MKKAIFIFFDRIIMFLYAMLSLYLVASSIYGTPIDVGTMSAVFGGSSAIVFAYLIVRGCNTPHKLEHLSNK